MFLKPPSAEDAEEWALDIARRIDKGEEFTASKRSQAKLLSDLIDIHLADMQEAGRPRQSSKAAVMDALKAKIGKVRVRNLSRERLIDYGRTPAKEGAGPATLAIDFSFQTADTGSLHPSIRRAGGSATPTSYAAPAGPATVNALIFPLDVDGGGCRSMSIKDFVKSPSTYCKAHVVTFYGGTTADPSYGGTGPDATGMRALMTYDRWSGGWKAIHYGMKPGQFVEFRFQQTFDKSVSAWGDKRIGKGSANMHTVTAFVTGADQGIRFLPWHENHVTFMEIDDSARTFFTGPLSGCAIYMGRTGAGRWWAFHANRNNAGLNSAMKGSMTKCTMDAAQLGVKVEHAAIYGRDYHDQGFVFGEKSGDRWRFYVCDVGAKEKAGHFSSKVRRL